MADGPDPREDPRVQRFVTPLTRTPPCWTCKHKHVTGPTCAAFPEQIPAEILDGTVQHRQPYPGDHGIQYEPEKSP